MEEENNSNSNLILNEGGNDALNNSNNSQDSFAVRKEKVEDRLEEVAGDDNEIERDYQSEKDNLDGNAYFVQRDKSPSIVKTDKKPEEETKEGKLTQFQATTYVINTILGAGTLGFPTVYKYFGLIPGTLLIFIFASLPLYSSYILLLTHKKTGKTGYSTFSKLAYGNTGSMIVKLIIIINNSGGICLYFKIISSVLNSIVRIFLKDKESFFYDTEWFYIVITAVVMIMILLKDKVEALKVSLYT